MKAKDRIIVALDVDSMEEAWKLVGPLYDYVGYFKVGLQLLTSEGAPRVVKGIKERGGRVLYDGKFDDIPNTIAGASRVVAKLGVDMFNVHASAGKEAIAKAVENKGKCLVLGVTVLTSIDEDECGSIFGDEPNNMVEYFAQMLFDAGADGVICSAKELDVLSDMDFLKVTPGIRPKWAQKGDQKRVMTPGEAIKAGADYLVIGRPIRKPPEEIGNPVDAAKRIAEEIEQALEKKGGE